MENFKTILNNSIGQIEVKRSKFIAHVFYVENEEEAKEKIREIKKKYFDARHNCFAYRVIQTENNNEIETIKEKSSDDGEPSGTAGAPILNILIKNSLLNTLVIVTRYFGGTLLGTGGLIRAYSDATMQSIEKAQITTKESGEKIEVELEYKELEKLKYYCLKRQIQIEDIFYENNVKCILQLNKEEKTKLIDEKVKDVDILDYKFLCKCYIVKNTEK